MGAGRYGSIGSCNAIYGGAGGAPLGPVYANTAPPAYGGAHDSESPSASECAPDDNTDSDASE